MVNKITPTIFFPKPQMKNKDYDIHYNCDHSLKSIDNHSHDYYEFYFLISGNITYSIENTQYILQSGDVLLISPGQSHHALINDLNDKYERYVLWLKPDYIESLSSSFTNLLLPFNKANFFGIHLHLSRELQMIIINLLQMLLMQINSQEYGADLLANVYITELLIHIARIKLYQHQTYSEKDFDNNDIVFNTLNYISEHINEIITIDDIANVLFISKSHLSKVFTGYMGISIHQYIVKKKLYLVKQELLLGHSIESVCSFYQFGNYSSFYRAFKNEFGMSPRALLKEMNGTKFENKTL